MFIDTIALHNFGVFRGRQEAVLTPPARNKPIVLFGGLNGGGKTTLLEGLQLALYGRHAPSAKQNGMAYEEYLRRSIHRQVSPGEGASVELSFRSNEDGEQRSYRVRRSWAAPNGRVHEHLEVFVDGQHDAALSETWMEQVERFIPMRLAHLFLFDGERVESLADSEKSRTVLSTAVHALLGVDLIDQLKTDMVALDRKKRRDTKTGAEARNIDQLEVRVDELEQHLRELREQRAAFQNDRDRTAKRLRDLQQRLTEQGGELTSRRHECEKEQADLQGQLRMIESQLVNAASGTMPLALVSGLLGDMAGQAEREERATRADGLIASLKDHDSRLLKALRAAGAAKAILAKAQQFCDAELADVDEVTHAERYLGLDTHGRELLRSLLSHRIREETDQALGLVTKVEELQNRIALLDRKLAAVPDQEAISDLLAKRDQLQKELVVLDTRLTDHDERIKGTEHERNVRSGELDKQLRHQREAEFDQQDVTRFLKHSERVQETLNRFRVALVARQVDQLESLILSGYRQLLRKQSLVSSVHISPEDCGLTLVGPDGQVLPEERLSAGERQLLAVAILWGLARAAGRPLPTVIDTPLGRLDASHRAHLVDRYFPYASHQVVLLSTDEEIDREFYERLRPWIGHVYRLTFDDSTASSSIEEGYFW
jgi:DNA sulfur modification protein DndD